jgi:hypothetical protein
MACARMGKLGDCRNHLCLVVDVGCWERSSACDMCWCYRLMVFLRVSSIFSYSEYLLIVHGSPTLPQPPPMSTHTIHAALFRATQPSLGSISLSALILAGVRLLGLMCFGLRALPAYLPPYLRFVSVGAGIAVGYLENVTNTLSTYALVYVGLTGDPFFSSARRSRALTGAIESASLTRYRQKFKSESECRPTLRTEPRFIYHTSSPVDYAHCGSADTHVPLLAYDVSIRCAHPECSGSGSFCCAPGRWCHSSCWAVLRWTREGCVCPSFFFRSQMLMQLFLARTPCTYAIA